MGTLELLPIPITSDTTVSVLVADLTNPRMLSQAQIQRARWESVVYLNRNLSRGDMAAALIQVLRQAGRYTNALGLYLAIASGYGKPDQWSRTAWLEAADRYFDSLGLIGLPRDQIQHFSGAELNPDIIARLKQDAAIQNFIGYHVLRPLAQAEAAALTLAMMIALALPAAPAALTGLVIGEVSSATVAAFQVTGLVTSALMTAGQVLATNDRGEQAFDIGFFALGVLPLRYLQIALFSLSTGISIKAALLGCFEAVSAFRFLLENADIVIQKGGYLNEDPGAQTKTEKQLELFHPPSGDATTAVEDVALSSSDAEMRAKILNTLMRAQEEGSIWGLEALDEEARRTFSGRSSKNPFRATDVDSMPLFITYVAEAETNIVRPETPFERVFTFLQKRYPRIPEDAGGKSATGEGRGFRQGDWIEVGAPLSYDQLDGITNDKGEIQPRWREYIAEYKQRGQEFENGIPLKSLRVTSVDPNPPIFGDVLVTHHEKNMLTTLAAIEFLFKDSFHIDPEIGAGLEFTFRDWLHQSAKTAWLNPATKSYEATFRFRGEVSFVIKVLWDGKQFVRYDDAVPEPGVKGIKISQTTLLKLQSVAENFSSNLGRVLERLTIRKPK